MEETEGVEKEEDVVILTGRCLRIRQCRQDRHFRQGRPAAAGDRGDQKVLWGRRDRWVPWVRRDRQARD